MVKSLNKAFFGGSCGGGTLDSMMVGNLFWNVTWNLSYIFIISLKKSTDCKENIPYMTWMVWGENELTWN